MKILVATDAWHPQVNGVVTSIDALTKYGPQAGADIKLLTADGMPSFGNPFYPEIRLAWPRKWDIVDRYVAADPDWVHIATEGPIGWATRRFCLKRSIPFTTSFHTRHDDYLAAYLGVPRALTWWGLRKFHRPSSMVMASTAALSSELRDHGFDNVRVVPLGVDTDLFRPLDWVDALPAWPRPIFLSVGRVSKEKNLDAFLGLDLPGTKVVVGDGPDLERLQKQYPDALFLGALHGEYLAVHYAKADVFVFPSLTDTCGLVMLEALSAGTPVAALPSAASYEMLSSEVAVIGDDLRAACIEALYCRSRHVCRSYALRRGWFTSVQIFVNHIKRLAGG